MPLAKASEARQAPNTPQDPVNGPFGPSPKTHSYVANPRSGSAETLLADFR